MKKSLFVFLSAFSAGLFAAHVQVAPEDVLFLAHFNSGIAPETGNAEEVIGHAKVTSGGKGFPFKNSAPRAEALNVGLRDAFLAFDAKRNFNPEAGTIQFMLKPQWNLTGYNHCVFFKLVFDRAKRNSLEWAGVNSFFIQKGPKQEVVAFIQDGNHERNSIKKAIPFGKDQWYQLTATWDAKTGKRAFYVDGELIGEVSYRKTDMPEEICFGGPRTCNAQSLIDEVRILKRVLTPAEVKQDYEALRAGGEFPAPPKPGSAEPELIPSTPEKQTGANGALTGTMFECPYLKNDIALDGSLQNPIWKQASSIRDFRFQNGKNTGVPSEVKVFYTQNALYIGAVMMEPDMKNLTAKLDQNDLNIWSDDSLEFVLDTASRPDTFYHFAVNALGSVYDAKGGNKSWNTKNIQVKTKRMNDRWSVEMKLPFSAFGCSAPQVGGFWGIRFCRERHAGTTEYTSNPQVKSGAFNQRKYLARMNFIPGGNNRMAELRSENRDFQMGMNQIKLNLNNLAGKKMPVLMKAVLSDADGKALEVFSLKKELPVGRSQCLFPVAVTDDRTERMSLTVEGADGAIHSGDAVTRGFSSTGRGLGELAVRLVTLERNMGDLAQIRHPVYQGAAKAVKKMSAGIAEYRKELDAAMKENRTVSKDKTESIAALANGFRKFQDQYRYLVWETSPWENGEVFALPPENFSADGLTLDYRMAGNEREVKTFILSGLLCGRRLDLRIQPRSCDTQGKPFVSNDQFEVYTEPFVDHNGSLITAPLVRAPGNIIAITPGDNVRVWVIFNSRGVPAGNYSTSIELKPLNDYTIPNRSIPVSLKIWNFTLPETHEWPIDCFFWTGQFIPLDETPLLRLMHEYHVKWSMTESHNYKNGFVRDRRWMGRAPKGKKYDDHLTRTANQEFFETAKKLKMKIVFAWGTAGNVEWHEIMSDRLLKMGFSYSDFIFHGLLHDEFSAKDIPCEQKVREEVKKTNPNWQFMATYLTTPPPSGATLDDIEKAGLADFFKVWSVISGRFEDKKQGPETKEFFRKHGNILWSYRCWTNMQTAPVLSYYRFFPWEGYLNGLDGVAFWSAYSSKGDDGFDHRDGYDDGITWRGLNKAPIPTKRLEAVREGLEDVAYMDLLKKAIAERKKKNPAVDCREYETLLTKRPYEIMRDESQKQLERWRQEVGSAIHTLNGAK